MSGTVRLRLREGLDEPIEVDGLTPDRLASLSEREITGLPVWAGRRRAPLGDFFHVHGERAAIVRIEGLTRRVHGVAAHMAGGELVIDGEAGDGLALEMSGGVVDVRGRVGDDAGLAMRGGVLRIGGDAGDRLGAARAGAAVGMTGGEIVVRGSAGAEAGLACRRGLIVIGGNAGAGAARSMIAGSLIALGTTGAGAGRFARRGSVVCIGAVDVLETYRYACTLSPPHLRLTMTYLNRRYGLGLAPEIVSGRYRRYCGDLLAPGKGEILVWSSSAGSPV